MGFFEHVHYYWIEKADPRVLDLPLMNSIYQMPLILFAYLYFVLGCGPRFMKNREPYSLKTFIQVYNIVQIVLNAWLVYDNIDAGIFTNSSLFCPIIVDYSYNYTPMRLTRSAWYYFLLKLLDFIETGIFVLRKKNNQVSGLHLYHHVTTSLVAWFGVRYYPIAPAAFNSMINSCIHVIMYTYYFLAALGPDVQKYIVSMKRWLTVIQMVQLCGLMLYVSQNFFCQVVPHWIPTFYIANLIMNFYLFFNFYQTTYRKSKKIQ